MTGYRRIPAASSVPRSVPPTGRPGSAGDRTPSPGGDDAVASGVEALRAGHLLAHPTGTVYGLGAGPVERDREIARLKGRPADRPLLRIAADLGAIRRTHPSIRWSDRALRLAESFWPGPLTLVLPDGSPTGLGVRVEGHPLTSRLLEAWGGTMSSTSLNRSGEPAARTSESARRCLEALPESEVPLIWLDAGDLPPSSPSTVLALPADGPPRLLRGGAVPLEELERCVDARIESEEADEAQRAGGADEPGAGDRGGRGR